MDFDNHYRLINDPKTVRIMNAHDLVWEGSMESFGLMLSALRGDLHKEWRCWREDGSYGPPCTGVQSRDHHISVVRHRFCCEIVYYEVR